MSSSSDLANALAYCRGKSAPPGSSLYYSTLFIPARLRAELLAVHAFGQELTGVLEECSDPGVMRVKFSWWREELARLLQHKPRHPVSLALADVLRRHELVSGQLVRLIDGMEALVTPLPWNELLPRLEQGPGRLWQITAQMCGSRARETPGMALTAGSLITGFQRLQQSPRALAAPVSGIADHYHTIQEGLEHFSQVLPATDHAHQLPLLIMARLVSRTCAEILRGSGNADRRVTLTPLRKLWIAWRLQHRYRR